MSRPSHNKKSRDSHAKLEGRVVHVSAATVRNKWKRLPPSHHSAARELILSTKEQSRTRRTKAAVDLATEESVQEVVNNLSDKLTRIPYPPSTDENHFDHEANIHRIQSMEEQLNANIHSMSLLRAQLAKEERLLEQDKEEVAYLEQSLKSNESLSRQQSRTLHRLARKVQEDGHEIDSLLLRDHEENNSKPSLMPLFQDEDMLPVLEQLQSHLNNMYGNVSSIKEVTHLVHKTGLELYTLPDTSLAP